MTTLAAFSSLDITADSYVAGQITSYTINFGHSLPISASSSVQISFSLPNFYTIINCSACQAYGYNLINITSTTKSVSISSVVNPELFPINISLYAINVSLIVDSYNAIVQNCTTCSIYNIIPSTFTFSINSNNTYLANPAQINLTISALPISTIYLLVYVPLEYSLSTISIKSEGSINISLISQSSNILNISVLSINSLSPTICIWGLTNPTVTTSSSWSLAAYSSSTGQVASSSNSVIFSAACGSLCKDCAGVGVCLSCYSIIPYLDVSAKTCVASCSASQYLINSTCYNCNSSCLTCSLTGSNCTSCSSSSFLLNSICYSSCPAGFYAFSSNCNPCINNCYTCTNAIICLSCTSGFVLTNSACSSSSCLSGFYNLSGVCTACPTNCSTCDSSGCLTCTNSTYLTLLAVPTCLYICPLSYFISSNNSNC